jgi:hypothetical protein
MTPAEMLVPVSDDHALRQFELEALRQITDNLRRLNDKADKQGEFLQTMDGRLIRIESNKLDDTVTTLAAKVDALESDRDRRDGAIGLAKGMPGVVPWIVSLVTALAAAIGWARHP